MMDTHSDAIFLNKEQVRYTKQQLRPEITYPAFDSALLDASGDDGFWEQSSYEYEGYRGGPTDGIFLVGIVHGGSWW